MAYATAGWEVFPCNGKVPMNPSVHPPGDPLRGVCHGECGADGHGVLDATIDITRVNPWWITWPNANIGGRVPAGVVLVDVDPRHGGDGSWNALIAEHGDVETRTVMSGRGDGGCHRYFQHPGGKLRASIGPGIDIKTSSGYGMLPPSIHPDSGQPYRWVDPVTPIALAPWWLAEMMIRRVDVLKVPNVGARSNYDGDSIADWYTETHTWTEVLAPHGWVVVHGEGETDGSAWRHPTATADSSATIRHGCLFVYSNNTEFEQTAADDPHGYTRFRAYAVLDHGDDMSAAARAVAITAS